MGKTLAAVFTGAVVSQTFGNATELLGSRGFACADLFGLDVMWDRQGHPLLLEANLAPSLWMHGQKVDWPMQQQVKETLVRQIAEFTWLRVNSLGLTRHELQELEVKALRNFI